MEGRGGAVEVQNTPLHLSELVASFHIHPQQQGIMHCLTQLTEHAQVRVGLDDECLKNLEQYDALSRRT